MRAKVVFFTLLLVINNLSTMAQHNSKPLKIAVIGLVHTHVHWILGREKANDIEIVAIVEPNRALTEQYAELHGYSMDIVYPTVDDMLSAVTPDAVTDFGTIYGHLQTVKTFAPMGIHVMVEKPLAVNLAHAKEMESLARKHGIHLLTNYETTWYPTTEYAIENAGSLGTIRKIVVHDGHEGPVKIGVNDEFLEWLIDPKLNGGGALTDFGCYGANLITAINNNQKPHSVTAITQQLQPDLYPEVEDEATIILTYPQMQGIIQASWNWSFSRKDWALYGTEGIIETIDGQMLYLKDNANEPAKQLTLESRKAPYKDPFAYFAAVVNGEIAPVGDLSSLGNNMIVMEILEAAKESATTGKTIRLKP